ncbi:hypothetical protein [Flavobacterium columnare]|uniref:hypothetical protein n=1 Tax=Flavobacterium columnare TaxID=996 RepID=UPI001BC8880D|nr:hypothetical protein [Flavobacterium columnare]AUX18787.1 hypothetical protein AQ623_11225 [Flavobacterium columnare]
MRPLGDVIIVHGSDVGKPFKVTLPVEVIQFGCVIAPVIGADGVTGCVLIVIVVAACAVQVLSVVLRTRKV